MERFEGGLEFGGLGPKFRRSLNPEGGKWEESFVLGKIIGWREGLEDGFPKVVFLECVKSFCDSCIWGIEQQKVGLEFRLEKESI